MAFGRKKRQQVEEEAATQEQRARLTPVDIQQRVFRLAFRGYNEQDVDGFLDQVTEDLAFLHEENKRLTEELELRAPGGGAEEARRHAEAIIRRAREEAARITSGAASGGGGPAPASFLVREREFLRRLAGLVQGHAEELKGEARRARERGAAGSEKAQEAQEEPEEQPQEQQEQEEPEETGSEGPPEPESSAGGETAPMATDEASGLREWSNPFVSDEASGPSGQDDEEEPSLRELFWGEE